MIISVALCTYNGEKYIEQQLESIFSQSVAVSEVVICDDCSSDATVQKIEKISSLYPDVVRLIVNPHNIGYRNNFSKALKECQGDYIFFCDQDDIWKPNKVEKSVAYLQSNGKYGVFTDADLIDGDNKEMGLSLFDSLNIYQYINNRNLYPDLFTTLCLFANIVTGATIAISKEAKPILLSSWPSIGPYHDYYIALKLSAIGKLGYLTDRLISYRIHPSQQIGVNIETTRKARLFDYKPDVDRYDFFYFLLLRRKNTLSITTEYNLNKTERTRLKYTYRLYIYSVIKDFPILSRIKAFWLYFKTELFVAAYPKLKRVWMKLQNLNR